MWRWQKAFTEIWNDSTKADKRKHDNENGKRYYEEAVMEQFLSYNAHASYNVGSLYWVQYRNNYTGCSVRRCSKLAIQEWKLSCRMQGYMKYLVRFRKPCTQCSSKGHQCKNIRRRERSYNAVQHGTVDLVPYKTTLQGVDREGAPILTISSLQFKYKMHYGMALYIGFNTTKDV